MSGQEHDAPSSWLTAWFRAAEYLAPGQAVPTCAPALSPAAWRSGLAGLFPSLGNQPPRVRSLGPLPRVLLWGRNGFPAN